MEKITTFPVGDNLQNIYIDFMIFTHIHADHTGLVVPTVLAHPEARVFFSRKTLEELKVVLADSLTVQRKETRKANFIKLPVPKVEFTKEDVDTFMAQAGAGFYEILNTDEEDEWVTFEDWLGWEFGFTFSGHTSGAFISAVKTPDGDGMVFSSDLSGHNQETTRGVKKISESFLKMAEFRKCRRIILITEATNGNRDQEESPEEMDTRLKAVLEETKRRGGQALFPVFMVNRGPNIVAKLVRLGFNVFVAGGVRRTLPVEVGTEIVDKWLADGTVMFIEDGPNYMAQLQTAARGEYGFRPIVTSSATLDQGACVDFAIAMLPIPENVLISTGHRFDGSAMKEFFEVKGRPLGSGHTVALTRTESGFRLVKIPVNVRCDGHHFNYSAHSFRKELVAFATSLKPDLVLVKHCTEIGFHGLESALHSELGEKCPPVNWARHLNLFEL
ncbi:MAG: hypothetical protein HYT64_01510 [Candidatus Yanofskybacteria bacterium]|nr:hypothetical protein [Candidatus Yanofskybacteria bacterium]